jgi:hypothetical protein
MPISINGTGTITGISAGGLPDACVTAADLASGAARSNFGAGCILQVQQTTVTAATFTTTSTSYVDVTDLSVNLTPSSSSNKVIVSGNINASCGSSATFKIVKVISGVTTDVIVGAGGGLRTPSYGGTFYEYNSYSSVNQPFFYMDSPATTNQVTYKIQVISTSGYTLRLNTDQTDTNQAATPRGVSNIIVMEVAG